MCGMTSEIEALYLPSASENHFCLVLLYSTGSGIGFLLRCRLSKPEARVRENGDVGVKWPLPFIGHLASSRDSAFQLVSFRRWMEWIKRMDLRAIEWIFYKSEEHEFSA